MASLEIKTVPPTPPPKQYVLTLTEEEAQSLRDLLGSGVGSTSLDQAKLRSVYNELTRFLTGRWGWARTAMYR